MQFRRWGRSEVWRHHVEPNLYSPGAGSRIHTAKLLRLSEDLPVVIEIVDTQEKIEKFLPFLDEVVKEGLITIEKVRVIRYVAGD